MPAGTGASYSVPLRSRQGYSTIRVPFNVFRPTTTGEAPLTACIRNLTQLAIRFEPSSRGPVTPQQLLWGDNISSKRFDIELDYIRVSALYPDRQQHAAEHDHA